MKKVVIIGGGFCGAYAACKLEKKFDVTLIDTKDYFEFTPGILRTLVEPQHRNKIQSHHSAYLKKTNFVLGEVTDVTPHAVFVKQTPFLYDYLVIASGSTYNAPIKASNVVISTRADVLQKYATKLVSSRSVLIIGGGIVGVELAAEVVEKYPEKKVIIVHTREKLMERQPEKAQKYAADFLTRKGVQIFFNERVVKKQGRVFLTDKKRRITADLSFLCTGIIPNSKFMEHHFRHELNDKKQVNVNEFLQFHGAQNIFVGGDVTNIVEEKTAQNAEDHAKIIVENIQHLERNQPLKKYVSSSRIMVISLGKHAGILTYKNFALTGFVPGLLKSVIEWREMKRYKPK